jgi:hypothetical protein
MQRIAAQALIEGLRFDKPVADFAVWANAEVTGSKYANRPTCLLHYGRHWRTLDRRCLMSM